MSDDLEWPVGISPENFPEIMGICSTHIVRTGRDMAGYFRADPEPDRIIYEVFEAEATGHLCMALTVLKHGMVGEEFHMTKGHFHEDDAAGEVYFCLRGKGLVLMETRDGQTKEVGLEPGTAAYIPPRWAHRTVNTGTEDLIMLAVFPTTSGHDYGTIKERGFGKRVLLKDGKATVV